MAVQTPLDGPFRRAKNGASQMRRPVRYRRYGQRALALPEIFKGQFFKWEYIFILLRVPKNS